MTEPPPSPLESFLVRYMMDREDGRIRPLDEYLAEHPGGAEDIAREYLALQKEYSDGVTLTMSRAPAPGGRFGDYEIEEEIGRGGQGVVYRARDVRLDRTVALKLLLGASSVEVQRFQREAFVASRIDHPSICPVYETGIHDGVPFIAMRFVEGDSLLDAIRSARDAGESGWAVIGTESAPATTSRDSAHATLAFAEQIARAIHHAHGAGVVHRDLKPGNIMVAEGRPVILDFGLAHITRDDLTTLTREGDVFGTPHYMSPEQFRGELLDERTDVWALGAILYEMLTLERPFNAHSRDELARRIKTVEPTDIRRLRPGLSSSRDLQVVVATALAKERQHRYQSAADLAEDIRRVRGHEPILARPAGPLLRLRRWSQRNPTLAVATLLLFVSLVAGLIVVSAKNAELGVARDEATSAAAEARTNLERFEQLADMEKLDQLHRDFDRLGPLHPSRLDRLDDWVLRADALIARQALHQTARDGLEARALPLTDADRREDRAHAEREHPELLARITRLEKRHAALVRERDTAEGEDRDDLADDIDEIADDLEDALESPELARRTWRFEGGSAAADAWRHAVLVDLLEGLERLPNRLGKVRRWREHVGTLRARSLEGAAAEAWKRCLAALAKNDIYRELALTPQLGLVPLGENPDTRHWEFWHVGSGDPPRLDGTGRWIPADDDAMILVLMPPARFLAGGQADDESAPNHDAAAHARREGPVHEVTLDAYFIGRHEVTQGQWIRMTDENPSDKTAGQEHGGRLVTSRHPVESINFETARDTLRFWGLDLPTEARWEFAARGGKDTAFHCGRDVKSLRGYANLADSKSVKYWNPGWPFDQELDDGWAFHAPVGTFRPNDYGLYDVHGNVGEWCLDSPFHYDERKPGPGDGLRLDPLDPRRMMKGGDHVNTSYNARLSMRYGENTDLRHFGLGARACRAVVEEETP